MSNSWRQIPFGELAAPARNAIVGGPFGSDLVSNDYVSSGTPVIRGQNMQGRWISGEFVYVTETKADSLSSNLARPGDLIFTQRGTLGQVALVSNQGPERYLISQSQMKAMIDPAKADPIFLYYFFSSSAQQEWIRSNAIQTGVPHTNLGILKKHPVLLPTLIEQRMIASVLSSLDDKIEQNRRTAKVLEKLARAIFKAWFVDFEPVKAKATDAAAFPGMPPAAFAALPDLLTDSPLGPVPDGWAVRPLSAVCQIISGGTPKRSMDEFWGGDIPWYSVKDAPHDGMPWVDSTDEQITKAGLDGSAATLVPIGCTIISARGTVGRLALVARPMAFNQSCYGLLPIGGASYRHLYLLLREAVVELQQRTHGSVFDTITRQTFEGLRVVLPESALLQQFERAVAPLFDLLLGLLKESSKLAALRDYLLPRLLSGTVQAEVRRG